MAQSQNKILGFQNGLVLPCSCAGPTEEPNVGLLHASAPALPCKVSKHWSHFLLKKCNSSLPEREVKTMPLLCINEWGNPRSV